MAQTGKSPEQYLIEDFITDETFVNYFFGLDAEDVARWEEWMLANPDRKDTVDAAIEMLRNLTLTLTDQEIKDETARMKAAIGFDAPPDVRKRPDLVRLLPSEPEAGFLRRKRKKSVLIVLPLVAVLLAAGYLVIRNTNRPERILATTNNGTKPIVFSLADGTTVTLSPQSVLQYSSAFGDRNRSVYLKGEAQFNVSRKTDKPFEVHQDDLVATVLGTIFSVKKLAADSTMVVDLIKGRLKVENVNGSGLPLTSIILDPDERVVYDRRDQRLYKERWQAQPGLTVEVSHILFQRDNFDEIAAKIKAVFGVTIVNKSKKRNWMFSGEFDNVTAADIIKNICVVERLDFQATGDTIFIK